jgi:hypothetical protein
VAGDRLAFAPCDDLSIDALMGKELHATDLVSGWTT